MSMNMLFGKKMESYGSCIEDKNANSGDTKETVIVDGSNGNAEELVLDVKSWRKLSKMNGLWGSNVRVSADKWIEHVKYESKSPWESSLIKFLSFLQVPSDKAGKVVTLAEKIRITMDKGLMLLGNDEELRQLTFISCISPVTFMAKVFETLLKDHPSFIYDVSVEDGAIPVSRELLREIEYYLGFADIAYNDDKDETLTEFLKRRGYIEMTHRRRTDIEHPAYYVSYNSQSKNVIIGIRGTSNLEDVFTDILCVNKNFLDVRYGHEGFINGAKNVLKGVRPFIEDLFKPLKYSYTIVGHSLGAGIASILTLFLKEEMKLDNVKCYGYGMPPSMDRLSALGARDYIISVVNNRDIIPRVSLSNMRIFGKMILHLNEKLQNSDMNAETISTEFYNHEVSCNSIIAEFREIQRKSKLQFDEDLYVPGKVVYLFEGAHGFCEGLEKDGTLFALRTPLVTKNLLANHMITSYNTAILEALSANFSSPTTHAVSVPEVSGTHVSITGFNYINVPGEDRSPIVFYKIVTSVMLRMEMQKRENQKAKDVGRYTVYRRFRDFRNLDQALKGTFDTSQWTSAFGFSSRLMNSSPDKRIPLLENYLRTVVMKVIKKDKTELIELVLDFLTTSPPDYVKNQLSQTEANKQPNSIQLDGTS
uniref:sn-1-specific diacylglycerol lipase n=2 Tax=Aplanochytrium stocchinoi TaxID=215587 RepID=A0A6S8C9I3_9STRA|mmetsp:Transcript_4193/g.5580  ORF Transcript_4193/g.5580 Transcript_4193/m.5580 type:complete len:649 (+) Transcript_4193:180-2126(+)|eukprot:CAMPEP_0204863280 /NCGR_PEP_ID=MMETSP1348-20121228/3196_1 /ASSEMBLY_ACC=CAM_ASM_000700 /TAXON_ID=215587 /ORGANISM="Aplanochytrium stocchinoi, Strain GSBS06" /LENGTH=648 /DNA_ID=CAMNT_0052013569 /DNA_START=123 /DNA_END=2069 /DNA_ORIENTATION=+